MLLNAGKERSRSPKAKKAIGLHLRLPWFFNTVLEIIFNHGNLLAWSMEKRTLPNEAVRITKRKFGETTVDPDDEPAKKVKTGNGATGDAKKKPEKKLKTA